MEPTDNTGSYKKLPTNAIEDFPTYFFSQACSYEASAFRLLSLWFPEGAKCASCGALITGKRALDTFWRGDRTYCCSCESKFSPWSGTLLDGSKLTPSQLEIILLGMTLSLPVKAIATHAGVLPETVNNWIIKIRFWESHA